MAKAAIHPNYQLATITCACGATYETASTRGSFAVEICARCHPFFTGKQKLNDAAGRIERFQKRYQLRAGASAVPAPKPKAEAKPKAEKPEGAEGEKAQKPKADKAEANKGGGGGGENKPKAEGNKSGGGGDKAQQKPKADKPAN